MFTGLIEDVGIVKSIQHGAKSARLQIETKIDVAEVAVGDSIAVNGVCLTVTEKDHRTFTVDVMWETLKKSNIGRLTPGGLLNLERAMMLGGRLDGHLVSGHVDGIASIESITEQDIATVIEFSADEMVCKYMIEKGSVAVDGVSLTIAELSKTRFAVSLIPHTKNKTVLRTKKVGEVVNIEVDLIAKYVERLMQFSSEKSNQGISYQTLVENGYL